MKTEMTSNYVTTYCVIGSPYTILCVRHVYYSQSDSEYGFFYDYWLNHKDYGYCMHMFGLYDSDFHDIFDDMDDTTFDSYVEKYLDDINLLEKEE